MGFSAFGHRYEVQLLDKVYTQDNIEVDFRIVYDEKSKSNTSKITLWNLAPKTIDALQAGTPIILKGGWPESQGVIFSGEIVRISTNPSGRGDTPTEIYVSQDRTMWFNATVNKEWVGPVKATTIIQELVGMSGFVPGFIDESVNFTYKRNWSFNGPVKDALIEIAEDCGARVYNESGKIFFMVPGKSTIQTIEVPEDNILESPRPTLKDKEVTGNWKLETILRWEARPGTVINLNSKYLKGTFTALSVEHVRRGDETFATKWEVSDGTGSTETDIVE